MKAEGRVWVFYDAESGNETKPMSVVQAQMLLLQLKMKDLNKFFIWTPGWPEWQCLADYLKTDQKYFAMVQPPRPEATSHRKNIATTKVLDLDKTKTAITNVGSTTKSTKKKKGDADFTQIIIGTPQKQEKIDYGYYHNDFTGDQLSLDDLNKVKPLKTETITHTDVEDDRRRAIRHNFKLEIVLINKEGSFRTFSKNISATGTLLEDAIPKSFLNKPFDLVIINRFEPNPQKARLLFKANIVGDLTNPRRLMFVNVEDSMLSRLEALLTAYVHYQQAMKKQTG